MPDNKPINGVRIDKWLWAARFYKTRSLASEAIQASHVRVNGETCKPSRLVKVGDSLLVKKAGQQFEIIVQDLSDKRGNASAAQMLYQETEASQKQREEQAELRKQQATSLAPQRRPDKRERGKIIRFLNKRS